MSNCTHGADQEDYCPDCIAWGKEKTRRGALLAGILGVKYIRREARYRTEWGTKTALGLYETAKRINAER
jgi:hypothetical protein